MFKQTLSIIQKVHISVSATATWELIQLIAQELTKAVRRFWAQSAGEVHEPVTSRLCLTLSKIVHITCSSKYVASMKNWQTFTGHARELTSGLAVRAKTVRANHESAKRWNWAKKVRKVSVFGCQADLWMALKILKSFGFGPNHRTADAILPSATKGLQWLKIFHGSQAYITSVWSRFLTAALAVLSIPRIKRKATLQPPQN